MYSLQIRLFIFFCTNYIDTLNRIKYKDNFFFFFFFKDNFEGSTSKKYPLPLQQVFLKLTIWSNNFQEPIIKVGNFIQAHDKKIMCSYLY